MNLLEQIGSAYQSLCNYNLGMAVQLFQSLPAHQQETAWVKGQMARAYFAGERFKKVCSTLQLCFIIMIHLKIAVLYLCFNTCCCPVGHL